MLDLVQAYRLRLGIPDDVSLSPTLDTLELLTQRHLACIPFENISLHLTPSKDVQEPPIVLDTPSLIQKILTRNRGGCCLELNGLFAVLLEQLGYRCVRLVPCFVAAGRERGNAGATKFRTVASHFVLLVNGVYLVDVGLGEPPLGVLHYHADMLDQMQVTLEGMQSRIRWDPQGTWVDGRTGKPRTCLIQEWCVDGSWLPRLQWDVMDAPLVATSPEGTVKPPPQPSIIYPPLESFAYVKDILMHPKSSFSRKLIVCRLTPTAKITLAGRCLKLTSPRFGPDATQTVTQWTTKAEVMKTLQEQFGIVLRDQGSLDLAKTDQASNTKLWDHL